MKKAILFPLLACMLIFSCKKEAKKAPDQAQKTYKVNFNVSGFTQTITNSTTTTKQLNSLKTDAATPITNYLDLLYYYVFDTNGHLVHSLNQDSTTTNFGNIADNLPAGTYTVVIVGGKTGLLSTLYPYAATDLTNWYIAYAGTTNGSNNGPWKDTFFDKFQLTVSSGDVNQNVTLNRIVGQLEVNIEDALPAGAASISVSVNPVVNIYSFATGASVYAGSLTFTHSIPTAAIGKTNYKVDGIISNTAAPFTVTINCYDASKKVLGSAIVDSVTCQPNKRTILSGKLFGSNNGFSINLSPWNPNPITIPY